MIPSRGRAKYRDNSDVSKSTSTFTISTAQRSEPINSWYHWTPSAFSSPVQSLSSF